MASASDARSKPASVSTGPPAAAHKALADTIADAVRQAGGWLAFDDFMALALYAPGLGYYANQRRKFGAMPQSGSDFVTAPELSPLFGRALAAQVRQGLDASGSRTVLEFGAGSGALAEQLLDSLGDALGRYQIIDLSGVLRERQQQRLARFGNRVEWLDRLPGSVHGVVLGNEVLDAMPVKLLHFDGQRWFERGVVMAHDAGEAGQPAAPGTAGTPGAPGEPRTAAWAWADRPTELSPPWPGPFLPGTVTELHQQAEAFVRTLAGVLQQGLAIFIDYGFPEAEYHHPQRHQGTLMCHRLHRADDNPLADVGDKDITAHVNFTGIALAGQDSGLDVAGYTSQAHFLFNCGLIDLMGPASLAERAMGQKLVNEHEMGELFKVLAFSRGIDLARIPLLGFAHGDRSHRL